MHFINNLYCSAVEKIKIMQYSKNKKITKGLIGGKALLVFNFDNPKLVK